MDSQDLHRIPPTVGNAARGLCDRLGLGRLASTRWHASPVRLVGKDSFDESHQGVPSSVQSHLGGALRDP